MALLIATAVFVTTLMVVMAIGHDATEKRQQVDVRLDRYVVQRPSADKPQNQAATPPERRKT